jgi:hypothetical protein
MHIHDPPSFGGQPYPIAPASGNRNREFAAAKRIDFLDTLGLI